jgi:hypothetical protein
MSDPFNADRDKSVEPGTASDEEFSQWLLADYSAFLEPDSDEVIEPPEGLVQLVLEQLGSAKVSPGDDIPSFTERRQEKARAPRLWKVMALAASSLLVVGVGGLVVQTLGEAGTPDNMDVATGQSDEVVPGLRGDAGTDGLDGTQVGELPDRLLTLKIPAADSEETQNQVSRIWIPDSAATSTGYSVVFVLETPNGTAEAQARASCSATGGCVVATIPASTGVDGVSGRSVAASIKLIFNQLADFEAINVDSAYLWWVDSLGVNVAEMQTDIGGIKIIRSLEDVR